MNESMSGEKRAPRFSLRPALPEEKALFFALPEEKDLELGTIGHVCIDFGCRGKEFGHTWWPRGKDAWNSDEFRDVLGALVTALRVDGPLKDIDAMDSYCRANGGEIEGGWAPCYGYVAETEHYRFCLRCISVCGDYTAYLTAFDLRVQEQNMQKEPEQGMTIGGM